VSVHSDHLIYDRESYAADGQCAPASVYGAPEAPRYSVARYVVGRAPYPLGQLVEHAPAHTLDEARAMLCYQGREKPRAKTLEARIQKLEDELEAAKMKLSVCGLPLFEVGRG
jgi:hypothetical protein